MMCTEKNKKEQKTEAYDRIQSQNNNYNTRIIQDRVRGKRWDGRCDGTKRRKDLWDGVRVGRGRGVSSATKRDTLSFKLVGGRGWNQE